MTDPTPKTTVFEYMSGLARELGAINLGAGLPQTGGAAGTDRGCAARACGTLQPVPADARAARTARRATAIITPARKGWTLLRQRRRHFGRDQALAASLLALVRPGDEVVLVQPLYDAYLPLIEWAVHGQIISLTPPIGRSRWQIWPQQSGRRRAGSAPTPPTIWLAPCWGAARWKRSACWLRRTICGCCATRCGKAWCSPMTRISRRWRCPRWPTGAIKIGSAGKIFSMTGWKVGWAVAAPDAGGRYRRAAPVPDLSPPRRCNGPWPEALLCRRSGMSITWRATARPRRSWSVVWRLRGLLC